MKKTAKQDVLLDKINFKISYSEEILSPPAFLKTSLIQICNIFHPEIHWGGWGGGFKTFIQLFYKPISQVTPDWTQECHLPFLALVAKAPHAIKQNVQWTWNQRGPCVHCLGRKTIPLSFPANTHFLYPFPSSTEDSRPHNVSYTGIVSVALSFHSFSLTNLFHFLQNKGGVDKIFHPETWL